MMMKTVTIPLPTYQHPCNRKLDEVAGLSGTGPYLRKRIGNQFEDRKMISLTHLGYLQLLNHQAFYMCTVQY